MRSTLATAPIAGIIIGIGAACITRSIIALVALFAAGIIVALTLNPPTTNPEDVI